MLPGGSDEEKREFLSDVTAFANAAGGDLIYGVRERREEQTPSSTIDAIVGLSLLNMDAVRLRLQSLLHDGVAPRMQPVTFHEIRRDPEPPCLLLRVPRSSFGLHMITFKNYSRFYGRTSAGKYQLDVHEIRAGFIAAETAVERLQRLRMERVARVISLETPAPIADGPKVSLHAFPINALEEVWARILTKQQHELAGDLPLIAGTQTSWRFNLDGFVTHTQSGDLRRQCYTQLFRDGGIEAVSARVIVRSEERGGFFAWGMEREVIKAFSGYQRFWQNFGVMPPFLVGLTISGVKNWKVLQRPYDYSDVAAVIDRDVILSPEVIVSDLAVHADVLLHPIFDFVWNAGGWPGSPNYEVAGGLVPRNQCLILLTSSRSPGVAVQQGTDDCPFCAGRNAW